MSTRRIGRPRYSSIDRLAVKQEEFQTILQYCDQFLKNHATHEKLVKAFTLLFHTGCRISELLQLEKGDIQSIIDRGMFSLDNSTKTGKPRLVLISDNGVEAIKELWEMEISPGVDNMKEKTFKGRANMPLGKTGVSGFTKLINKHMKLALESDLYSSHSFRQGVISDLLNGGVPLSTVSGIIGHANISTTLKYHRATKEEKENSINLVR